MNSTLHENKSEKSGLSVDISMPNERDIKFFSEIPLRMMKKLYEIYKKVNFITCLSHIFVIFDWSRTLKYLATLQINIMSMPIKKLWL